MFYFLYGTDTGKSFEKSQQMVNAMLKKKPDASLFKLGSDDWSDATFQELIGGQGLFAQKYIVTLSRVLGDSAVADTVLKMVQDIAESENIFIWVEDKVDSKTLKKIEKHATKVELHNIKEKYSEMQTTAFPLTDAIGLRDKKKAWLIFNSISKKIAVEEIHGTVVWLFKSMTLALKTKTPSEAGMKPFVHSKAKNAGSKFTPDEIEQLYFRLLSLSHDARRGKGDLGIGLERFILEL